MITQACPVQLDIIAQVLHQTEQYHAPRVPSETRQVQQALLTAISAQQDITVLSTMQQPEGLSVVRERIVQRIVPRGGGVDLDTTVTCLKSKSPVTQATIVQMLLLRRQLVTMVTTVTKRLAVV